MIHNVAHILSYERRSWSSYGKILSQNFKYASYELHGISNAFHWIIKKKPGYKMFWSKTVHSCTLTISLNFSFFEMNLGVYTLSEDNSRYIPPFQQLLLYLEAHTCHNKHLHPLMKKKNNIISC